MTPPPAAAAAAAPAPARPKPRPRTQPRSKPRPKSRAAAGSLRRPKMTVYRSSSAMPAVAAHAGVAAAGRIGLAVRELPDSGLVHRLTRGRAWIGVLGALLAGIVALNVLSLSLTAGSGTVGAQIDQLQTDNSALRSELAEKLSAPKVESMAGVYGLSRPAADDITYLDFKPEDLIRAAKLLVGEIVSAAEAWTPPSEEPGYVPPSDTPSSDSTGSYTPPVSEDGASETAAPESSAPEPSTATPTAPTSGGVGTGPGL